MLMSFMKYTRLLAQVYHPRAPNNIHFHPHEELQEQSCSPVHLLMSLLKYPRGWCTFSGSGSTERPPKHFPRCWYTRLDSGGTNAALIAWHSSRTSVAINEHQAMKWLLVAWIQLILGKYREKAMFLKTIPSLGIAGCSEAWKVSQRCH